MLKNTTMSNTDKYSKKDIKAALRDYHLVTSCFDIKRRSGWFKMDSSWYLLRRGKLIASMNMKCQVVDIPKLTNYRWNNLIKSSRESKVDITPVFVPFDPYQKRHFRSFD